MQVVYIDILFLLNFVMDGMIFYISTQLLGNQIKPAKIIIASFIASLLYCLVIYFPLLQRLPLYIYYFCIPIIPILYIFRPISLKEFTKYFLVSMVSAFIIGGGVFNFYYLIQQEEVNKLVQIGLPLSVGILICVLITLSFKWLRKRFILPQFEYDITLHNLEKQKYTSGIVDTGNHLYTMISHRPVSIIYYENIKELLSVKEKELLDECRQKGIMSILGEMEKFERKMYLIPFKSVGCKEGMLLGIEIEKIIIAKENYKKEFNRCIVGICFEPLFEGDKYEVLVHPDFIIN